MIETKVVSLSTSLLLLESQYGRLNSNGESWSHYVRKNRSSGPTLIVRISTRTGLTFYVTVHTRVPLWSYELREGWSHSVRKNRKNGPSLTVMIDTPWSHFLRNFAYTSPAMVVSMHTRTKSVFQKYTNPYALPLPRSREWNTSYTTFYTNTKSYISVWKFATGNWDSATLHGQNGTFSSFIYGSDRQTEIFIVYSHEFWFFRYWDHHRSHRSHFCAW